MLLSLIAGLVFFYTNHVEFVSAALEYNKMNIPNLCYVLLRIIGGLFIPAVFIMPSLFEFGRIKLTRICFIAYGICHIIAISWIIYFFASNPPIDIFSSDKVFSFLRDGGFVYTFAFWDNYSLISVLFSLLYGIVAIYTGINFDKDKALAKAFVSLLLTLRVVLPLLFNIFSQGRFFSLFWITNNALEVTGQLLFTVAIIFAGANNYTWIEFVWDQIAFAETDDSDQQ